MANIQKRPNGTWRARYRDSAGKEHARHFARRVDAQAWLDGVTTAVQTGAYVDPVRARKTVGELSEQWLVGKVNLKPSTQALYESILSTHILPPWRDVPLTRVEHGDVQTLGRRPHGIRPVTESRPGPRRRLVGSSRARGA
jgi:hypothetical protein